ncbi:MAG: hypothetical protein ABI972_23135 [Acidobacteriota bacterium]
MAEWQFAHAEPDEQFAQLHHFSMLQHQDGREIEFLITVKEFVKATDPAMKFFAQANKQTNQKTMAFTPVGWGGTMLQALSDCMRAVRRFPYEGE